MASFLSGLRRFRQMFNPPGATKTDDVLKFGKLGAANIACRARQDYPRAAEFAEKYKIPNVMDDYQAILDDPDIDVVYIPLPNGLHLEWALKALAKGKHVLLEKPSTSNSTEAEILFHSPLLTEKGPEAPVLVEAFHNRFASAWRCFMSTIDQPRVSSVRAFAAVPGRFIPPNDIRFNYELAGGALMDIGTYCVEALRVVYGVEPEACLESEMTLMPAPKERCDGDFKILYKFPPANESASGTSEHKDNSRLGIAEGGLQLPLMSFALPRVEVEHYPIITETEVADGSARVVTTVTREVVFYNFMFPNFYHRIDIEDEIVVERVTRGADGSGSDQEERRELISKSTTKEYKKAYTFRDINVVEPGEEYWQTYRWMLEQFVNRVRGRVPSASRSDAWVTHEDSIAQMKALDVAYEKAGLGIRPSGAYAAKRK